MAHLIPIDSSIFLVDLSFPPLTLDGKWSGWVGRAWMRLGIFGLGKFRDRGMGGLELSSLGKFKGG